MSKRLCAIIAIASLFAGFGSPALAHANPKPPPIQWCQPPGAVITQPDGTVWYCLGTADHRFWERHQDGSDGTKWKESEYVVSSSQSGLVHVQIYAENPRSSTNTHVYAQINSAFENGSGPFSESPNNLRVTSAIQRWNGSSWTTCLSLAYTYNSITTFGHSTALTGVGGCSFNASFRGTATGGIFDAGVWKSRSVQTDPLSL